MKVLFLLLPLFCFGNQSGEEYYIAGKLKCSARSCYIISGEDSLSKKTYRILEMESIPGSQKDVLVKASMKKRYNDFRFDIHVKRFLKLTKKVDHTKTYMKKI